MAQNRLIRLGKSVLVVGVVTVFLAAWGVLATIVPPLDTGDQALQKTGDLRGWGAEVLEAETGGFSPIAEANACGLGASSCFKCHNGQRAEAPADKAWHTDHASVNHSCDGCHDGNPRLLKESIAHRGMMPNPVDSPEKACFECHQDGDAGALVDAYRQKLAQGG